MSKVVAWRGSKAGWTLLCWIALVGCGSTPDAPPPADSGDAQTATGVSVPVALYESRQRERAQSLLRQGRLADAAIAWEVLTVLRPDAQDYRDKLAETRRLIGVAVAERLQRAQQAQRRGETDTAQAHYLAVLALQPEQPQAADALRAIERERNRRNYLGKYSRLTLTRKSMSEAEMRAGDDAGTGQAAARDRNADLEHASLMASQGEFADAIALLERMLAAKREKSVTRLLANVYYQQGAALIPTDRDAALKVIDRAVALDPTHAAARARAAELRRDPKTLPVAASASSADKANRTTATQPGSRTTSVVRQAVSPPSGGSAR